MKYFTRSEWMILAGLFVLSFVPVSTGIFRLVELGGGAAMLPENPRVTAAPIPVVLHIICVAHYLRCSLLLPRSLPISPEHPPSQPHVAPLQRPPHSCFRNRFGSFRPVDDALLFLPSRTPR